jgi:hypothetical protein
MKNKKDRKFSLLGPVDIVDIKSPLKDTAGVHPEVKAYKSLKNS